MPASKRRMSINLRWLTWRARLSIPSLLASCEEREVISLISGVNVALAILTISLLAWFTGLPLVFPALGPTAFILFSKPFSPDAMRSLHSSKPPPSKPTKPGAAPSGCSRCFTPAGKPSIWRIWEPAPG